MSQTSQGFYEIKKKKLDSVISGKKKLSTDVVVEEEPGEDDQIINIDGINLIKNPFEVAKTKKGKKKR